MTLATLRTLVKALIFDRAQTGETPPFADAALATFLNMALETYVVPFALTVQADLFVTSTTVSLTGGTGRLAVLDLAGKPYPRVKRLLAAWRTDGASPRRCGIVHFGSASLDLAGTAEAAPRLALYNESVAVLDPPATGNFELHYRAGLPEMVADTDTPGQASGSGTANFLPIEYHPLVALKAAVLALEAEKADAAALRDEYVQAVQGVLAALRAAAETSEDG